MPERSDVRETVEQIQQQIADQIREDVRERARMRAETEAEAEKYVEHAKRESPVEYGAYAAAWHVEDRPDTPEGLPAFIVVNRNWKAHFIEFGTGEPGPTKAWNVAAKTAAYYGGTAG